MFFIYNTVWASSLVVEDCKPKPKALGDSVPVHYTQSSRSHSISLRSMLLIENETQ